MNALAAGPHCTHPVAFDLQKKTWVPPANVLVQTSPLASVDVALASGAPSGMSNAFGHTGSEPHQLPQMWYVHFCANMRNAAYLQCSAVQCTEQAGEPTSQPPA